MAKKTLGVPSILVDGKKIKIIPGSFEFESGDPEITVRAVSGGGDDIESVHTVNVEGAIGIPKFALPVTSENLTLVRLWKQRVGDITVEAVQKIDGGDSITLVFPGCSMTNKFTGKGSTDGTIPIELGGDPMISQ